MTEPIDPIDALEDAFEDALFANALIDPFPILPNPPIPPLPPPPPPPPPPEPVAGRALEAALAEAERRRVSAIEQGHLADLYRDEGRAAQDAKLPGLQDYMDASVREFVGVNGLSIDGLKTTRLRLFRGTDWIATAAVAWRTVAATYIFIWQVKNHPVPGIIDSYTKEAFDQEFGTAMGRHV